MDLFSIGHGFLFPFMKLAPDLHQVAENPKPDSDRVTKVAQKPITASGLSTFRGMPNPLWFSKTIDGSKTRQQSAHPNGQSAQSSDYDSTDICSYPCQRVPYYLKFEHALIMNGLEREISSIMTSPAVNSKGYVDVGRCQGSCRKAEAQNIRVRYRKTHLPLTKIVSRAKIWHAYRQFTKICRPNLFWGMSISRGLKSVDSLSRIVAVLLTHHVTN